MKTTFAAAAAAALAFSTSAIAQSIQSAPFFLVAHTHDKKYNGTAFDACHEGAGIEGLCAGSALNKTNSFVTYNFNSSQPQTNANVTGSLVFTLHGGNFNESEAMTFFHDASTNVALPLFEPVNYGQQIGFDERNRMYATSALNDRVTPPTFQTNQRLYRWYICETNFEGYVYETLSFVTGVAEPQNPSCCAVSVVRQFI